MEFSRTDLFFLKRFIEEPEFQAMVLELCRDDDKVPSEVALVDFRELTEKEKEHALSIESIANEILNKKI